MFSIQPLHIVLENINYQLHLWALSKDSSEFRDKRSTTCSRVKHFLEPFMHQPYIYRPFGEYIGGRWDIGSSWHKPIPEQPFGTKQASPLGEGWETALPAELLESSELWRIAHRASSVCTTGKEDVLKIEVKLKEVRGRKWGRHLFP